MELELSLRDFEGLYQRLDKLRSSSTTVTVDRASLTTLLRDHSRLIKRLTEVGERPTSPGE